MAPIAIIIRHTARTAATCETVSAPIAGSITVSPERRPSAQRLQRLRDRIARSKTICVFAEPQFDQALVRTVVEGTKAKTGTLDYVGAEVPPGADHYFIVMRGLAKDLSSCLSQG